MEEHGGTAAVSSTSNRLAGIALACLVAIVGFGFGGRLLAPPTLADRVADSATDATTDTRPATTAAPVDGPSVAIVGPVVASASDHHARRQGRGQARPGVVPSPAVGTGAIESPAGITLGWAFEGSGDRSTLVIRGSVDPRIGRVTVGLEQGTRSIAQRTVSAAVEDERTGTDGGPRGTAAFEAAFPIGTKTASLTVVVSWLDPSRRATLSVRVVVGTRPIR